MSEFNTKKIITFIKNALEEESKNILQLSTEIPVDIVSFINDVVCTDGRVIIIGLGKSGHIGKKIAATLASTGTPSFFIHSTEANHGDLGMIKKNDVCVIISNSGETKEHFPIIEYCKKFSIKIAAISSDNESTLMESAHYKLKIPKCDEICPIGLAPTTSAIVTLALGDAMAACLMNLRGFNEQDYGVYHPAGKLGFKTILVSKIMHQGSKIPIVNKSDSMELALIEMTSKGFGITGVCEDNYLIGVITDGDLRRNIKGLIKKNAYQVATKNPIVVTKGILAIDALKIMNQNHISALLVVDDKNSPIGIIHLHDILRLNN